MSTATKSLPQPVAKIAAKFKQLRTLDDEPGEDCDESVETVIKKAQHIGYAATTSKPRRGAVLEYNVLLDVVVPTLLNVSRSNVFPARSNTINFRAGEMWREAECFLHCPFSFSRLKALPELRQIISHTCLDVVHAAAGRMTSFGTGEASTPEHNQQQQQQQQQDDKQGSGKQRRKQRIRKSKPKSKQRGWDALDDLDLDSDDYDFDSDDSSENGFDQMRGSKQQAAAAAGKRLRKLLGDEETPLLLHIAPGLRLCLAAEVAVGMLCQGQNAPPDTPEHAAALQMFVMEACAHAEAETVGDTTRYGQLPVNTPAAVSELLSGLVPSKQHPGRRYFAASTVQQSPLAPHLDLQLQLPPQQQLQLVNEAATAATQQQHGQQQEAGQALPSSILAHLHPDCQQQLLQLLAPWRDAAAALAAVLQDSSSSDTLFAALLQDCTTLLEHAGKQQQHQEQQQAQRQQEQHAMQREDCDGAAASASCLTDAPAGPDEACSTNSGTNGSSVERQAAASVASIADTVLHRMSTFASCLVLQFVEEACPSDGAATTPAWQQAVPLQVLLLCSQVQQLQGAMQRCIVKLQQSSQQQQQQDDGQQQQQGQPQQEWRQAETAQQEPEQPQQRHAAQAAQPEQCLVVLVEHVVGLLQSIRRFKDVNEALNSTSASGNGTTAAGCAGDVAGSKTQLNGDSSSSWSSSSHDSSSDSGVRNVVQPLDPACFFSAGGPLAGGLWGFTEPARAGIWAPLDAAGVASPQQQQQQQQQQRQLEQRPGTPRHTSSCPEKQTSRSGSAATPSAVPQQAWQVLLGSCAWQQALHDVDERVAANLQPTEYMFKQLRMQLFRFVRDVSAIDKLTAEAYVQQFKALGIDDLDMHTAVHACAVPHALEQMVRGMRGSALARLGFDEHKWARRRRLLEKRKWRRLELATRLDRAGYGELRKGTWVFNRAEIKKAQLAGVLAPHEDPLELENASMWDEEDELDIMQREVDADTEEAKEATRKAYAVDEELKHMMAMFDDEHRAQLPDEELRQWEERELLRPQAPLADGAPADASSNNGSSSSSRLMGDIWGSGSSSSSSRSTSPRTVPSAGNGVVSAVDTASASPSLPGATAGAAHVGSTWVLPEEVSKAEHVLREFAAQCSTLFAPLLAWYASWVEQKDSLFQQSEAWWKSDERRKLAADGARGNRPSPTSGSAASKKANNGSSSSSNSEWRSGGHDFCASCPLCQQDQQQHQSMDRHPSNGISSASELGNGCSTGRTACGGGTSSDAVSYSDPFMWRRLLWQLLGKLSPESQAFLAQYLAACPHCPDYVVWHHVKRSLIVSMWSSPAADPAEQQLANPSAMSIQENAKRAKRVLQYARTLNNGFVQLQHPFLPLQAKQLLLALSPLHAQLLPRPETAFLCPSSFPAVVGKALAGQLLSRPVLDMFQHDQAHLTMWHVWWHIGLRRYAAMRQQQQLQQQVDGMRGHAEAGIGGWLGATLSADELDSLYMDPDAKVYAVHFATRQLSGTSSNAWSSSSNNSSSSGCGIAASRPEVSPEATAAADAAMQAALNFADMARRRVLVAAMKENLRREVQALAPDYADVPWSSRDSTSSSSSGLKASSSSSSSSEEASSAAAEGRVTKAELLVQQAALLTASMCADLALSDRALLLNALQFPIGELLTPAAQRRLLANQSAITAGIHAAEDFLKQFTWNGTGEDQIYGGMLKRVQEWRHKQPLHWLQPQSDIQALALQPPVPIEALVHQVIFVNYLTTLQSCFNSCDSCGQNIGADDEVQECATCGVARYCCPECLANNAEEHAVICQQLVRGKQRYLWLNGLKPGSGPGSGQPQAFWRLLEPLLQPTPEPLGFSTDASAIESCGCWDGEVTGPGLLPMELIVAEAGRLYGEDLEATRALSAVARAVLPWKRYMP